MALFCHPDYLFDTGFILWSPVQRSYSIVRSHYFMDIFGGNNKYCLPKGIWRNRIKISIPKWTVYFLLLACLFYYGCKIYQQRQYALYKSARGDKEWAIAEDKLLKSYNQYLFSKLFGISKCSRYDRSILYQE